MTQISYTNKVENGGTTADGKVSAANMNEIKATVNINELNAISFSNASNVETITYVNKLKAKTNTYIDPIAIQAIDKFFTTGKADGWLPLMKWIWCPMGSSFAGSLINLYNVTGVPNELTNNNFVSSDYSQKFGFGTGSASNPNKYLDLGFTPDSIGLSNTNIAMGEFIPDDTAGPIPGFIFSVNTTDAGDPQVFSFRSDGNIFSRSRSSGGDGAVGCRSYDPVLIASFGPSNKFIGNVNGSWVIDSNTTMSTTVALNVNPTLFVTLNYTSHYANGRMGLAFISSFLTGLQSKSLANAIRDFMIQIKRLNNQGSTALFMGDSITFGAASSLLSNKWTSIVATNIGQKELNFGVGSCRLNSNISGGGADGVQSVMNRYLDSEPIDLNTVFIMIGTNDVGIDGTASGDPTLLNTFSSNYTTVLNYYLSKRYSVVVVGLPFSTNSTALLRSAYQNITLSVAQSLNAPYVDCETLFSDKSNPSSFFTDGTHPNSAGHKLIGDAVIGVTKGRLNRTPIVTFSAIASGGFADLVFAVMGCKVNNTVGIGLTTVTAGLDYRAFVSSANNVTIRCTNSSGGAITPPSQYINLTVTI